MTAAATQLVESIFGPDAVRDLYAPDHTVEISVGNAIAAHVGVFQRRITVAGSDCDIAGIGFVCTLPDFRGCGLATAALKIAHKRCLSLGLPFALLWGSPRFYQRLGYQHAANLPVRWLVKQLGAAPWPERSPVDLRGTW